MATQSFYEDMVIDSPEAAANLTELFESGTCWIRGDTRFEFVSVDSVFDRKFIVKHMNDDYRRSP